jgi:hypothetical protein
MEVKDYSAECSYCASFSGSDGAQFLWCAIHPYGPSQGQSCPDYRELVEDDSWFSTEGSAAGDELIQTLEDLLFFLSPPERSHWLKSCPSYTGVCPRCLGEFEDEAQLEGEWSCPSCSWVDTGE